MKRSWLHWIAIPVIAFLVVVLDQWTKGLIEARIPLGEGIVPLPALGRYFNLVHFSNTGAAFGLFRGQNLFFVVVALIVVAAVLYFARSLPDGGWGVRIALGLMLGGAIGNLIDRIQNGHVTDFLLFSLPVGARVYVWPAFNVADASLVAGVILLSLILLLQDIRDREGAPAS